MNGVGGSSEKTHLTFKRIEQLPTNQRTWPLLCLRCGMLIAGFNLLDSSQQVKEASHTPGR